MQLRSEDIGGGVVRRRFSNAKGVVMQGTRFTGDQVRAMKNHRQLIEGGRLDVWPAGVEAAQAGERFLVHRGRGKYDVIEGRKVNDTPISKDEAEALVETNH